MTRPASSRMARCLRAAVSLVPVASAISCTPIGRSESWRRISVRTLCPIASMMIFTSVGISGGAGSDGMDRIVPDTPIAKGSRNAWVNVMMTVQHAAGRAQQAAQRDRSDQVASVRHTAQGPSAPWAGVSEGHSMERTQRRTHRGASRLIVEGAVAIAAEPAAHLRGHLEGSNTGDSAARASVPSPRQRPSRSTCSSPPVAAHVARLCRARQLDAPAEATPGGSCTNFPSTCPIHRRDGCHHV